MNNKPLIVFFSAWTAAAAIIIIYFAQGLLPLLGDFNIHIIIVAALIFLSGYLLGTQYDK
tara:strand:+ start:49 stop:228 length:180 start_codon:yes stop_codon:yes gene_type:complete